MAFPLYPSGQSGQDPNPQSTHDPSQWSHSHTDDPKIDFSLLDSDVTRFHSSSYGSTNYQDTQPSMSPMSGVRDTPLQPYASEYQEQASYPYSQPVPSFDIQDRFAQHPSANYQQDSTVLRETNYSSLPPPVYSRSTGETHIGEPTELSMLEPPTTAHSKKTREQARTEKNERSKIARAKKRAEVSALEEKVKSGKALASELSELAVDLLGRLEGRDDEIADLETQLADYEAYSEALQTALNQSRLESSQQLAIIGAQRATIEQLSVNNLDG